MTTGGTGEGQAQDATLQQILLALGGGPIPQGGTGEGLAQDATAKVQAVGSIWELTDEWYAVLKARAVRLRGWPPAAILSAAPHVRAIVDATTKKPATHVTSTVAGETEQPS